MSEEKDRIEWWYEWNEEDGLWEDLDGGPCPEGLLEWFEVPSEAREMWFVASRRAVPSSREVWSIAPSISGLWFVSLGEDYWVTELFPIDVHEDLRELSGEGVLWVWIEWR